MKKLIIGNWKLNPTSLAEAKKLQIKIRQKISGLRNVQVAICPPTVYLSALSTGRAKAVLALGAQEVFWQADGAYTGQTSPLALKDLGANLVIIGHSEQRALGETDDLVNQKIKAVLDYGLRPLLCVGEKERDDSGHYLAQIKRQLEDGLDKVPKKAPDKLIIAYEPVWAIGKNALGVETPEGFLQHALFIRKTLSVMFGQKEAAKIPILYGGSVSIKNAETFLRQGQADGLLVGRESLDSVNFSAIAKLVNQNK